MTRRRRIIWLSSAAAIIIASVLLMVSARRREPVLNGKTFSEWAVIINANTSDELKEGFAPFGPEALPVLLTALETKPGNLQRVYNAAYPKLPALLRVRLPVPENYARLRWEAANLLGAMGSNAAPAIPSLLKALDDKDRSAKLSASSALVFIRLRLGRNHPLDAEAVAHLSRAMKDPDPNVRWNTVHGVYWFGDAATNALPAIQEATQDVDPRVREVAAEAIRDLTGDKSHKPRKR